PIKPQRRALAYISDSIDTRGVTNLPSPQQNPQFGVPGRREAYLSICVLGQSLTPTESRKLIPDPIKARAIFPRVLFLAPSHPPSMLAMLLSETPHRHDSSA